MIKECLKAHITFVRITNWDVEHSRSGKDGGPIGITIAKICRIENTVDVAEASAAGGRGAVVISISLITPVTAKNYILR